MNINSEKYWNNRFKTNWISNKGMEQSAFFARLALSAFPEWLIEETVSQRFTLCDWGCALGDGTNELALAFPKCSVTGIDFSSVAIEEAKKNYPNLIFSCTNLLASGYKDDFDLFFSSNTLEHFSNPWEIAVQLIQYAKKHLVILIPYKEIERYGEHMYTFDERNIASAIGASFFLSHIQIIDGSQFKPSYWGQLQVLLVYSTADEIARLSLKKISDLEIRLQENIRQQSEVISILLKEKESQITTLQIELELTKQKAENAITEAATAKADAENAFSQKAHQYTEMETRIRALHQAFDEAVATKKITEQELQKRVQQAEEKLQLEQQALSNAQASIEQFTWTEKEVEKELLLHQQLFEQKDALINSMRKDLTNANIHIGSLQKSEIELTKKVQEVKQLQLLLKEANGRIEVNKFLENELRQKEISLEESKVALSKATIRLDIASVKEKELQGQILASSNQVQSLAIEIKELKEQQEADMEEIRKRHTVQVDNLRSDYEEKVTKLKDHKDAELAQLRKQADACKAELRKDLERASIQAGILSASMERLELRVNKQDQIINEQRRNLNEAQIKIENSKFLQSQLEEKARDLEKLGKELLETKVQAGIKILLEEKLSEKETIIRNLRGAHDQEQMSKNELLSTVEELQKYIAHLEKHLAWYNATFEKRSIWGILKDKTVKANIKK